MPNTIPNLDAMNIDDVAAFARDTHTQRRKVCEALIGDRRKGYTKIAKTIVNYAYNKATAMRCRLNGTIAAAVNYETICDRIYAKIPDDLRW